MVSFKGAHFVKDILLTCVRWYVAYPLSYRQVAELMEERGAAVDHATINVDGRYNRAAEPEVEVIHLTRGDSCDHRSDLNHVMLDLMVEHQAGPAYATPQ